MSTPPERCQSNKCKADEIQLVDSYLHTESEYRETYECLVCGRSWNNIYKYSKTKRVRNEETVG